MGGSPKAPKPEAIPGPPKEVEVNRKATALAKADIQRKKGFTATALAGETGGYGSGYAGSTALS